MNDKNESFVLETSNPILEDMRAQLSMVLTNGDLLLSEIKKAQQLSAELEKTLRNIQNFKPEFRLK